jgi:hypothetical protein
MANTNTRRNRRRRPDPNANTAARTPRALLAAAVPHVHAAIRAALDGPASVADLRTAYVVGSAFLGCYVPTSPTIAADFAALCGVTQEPPEEYRLSAKREPVPPLDPEELALLRAAWKNGDAAAVFGEALGPNGHNRGGGVCTCFAVDFVRAHPDPKTRRVLLELLAGIEQHVEELALLAGFEWPAAEDAARAALADA